MPPDFGWLVMVGLAAQLVDRAIGTRYAMSASALLVTFTLSIVLWLQLGRLALAAPLALLLGAAAGVPLATFRARHLPRRTTILGVAVVVFLLAAAGLHLSLT